MKKKIRDMGYGIRDLRFGTFNRRGMALFMPVFTIIFIIAIFTLASYSLSDKIETLKATGVGAEAVLVEKSTWTTEIEKIEQESILKESLCNALNNTQTELGQYFENTNFEKIVEAKLQETLEKESPDYTIGITNTNPLSFEAIPKNTGVKTMSTTLYNTETRIKDIQKKTIEITRPTLHTINIKSEFHMTPIITARNYVQEKKKECEIERTQDTRTECMKDITKDNIEEILFIIKSSSENSALGLNDYTIEVVSVKKPEWCTKLGRTMYRISLPDITTIQQAPTTIS